MSLTIACPSCGLVGQAPADLRMPQVQCPRCGTLFALPRQAEEGPAVSPAAPQPPVGPQPPAAPQPPAPDPIIPSLDAFFSRIAASPESANWLGKTGMAYAVPPPDMPAPLGPEWLSQPPGRTAEEHWLREEWQRLRDYLERQFSALQQQREEHATWQSQVEARLVTREQDINRQLKHLAHRNDDLKRREAEVAQRQAALDRLRDEVREQEEDLRALQESMQNLEKDYAVQHRLLGQLRQETEEWQRSARIAKTDYQALDRAVTERRRAWETGQADLKHGQEELERRRRSLEHAEAALERRVLEIDEMEQRVLRELEQQRNGMTA